MSGLQTQEILDSRLREELNISLSISVYDVVRNETARQHRQELVSVRYSLIPRLPPSPPPRLGMRLYEILSHA